MLSTIYSAGLYGIDGFIVTVEADGQPKLPNFELVGLPDMAVKEAKERVRTACINSGFRFPELAFMLNLAPADRKKEGSAYDVAILLGIMISSGIIRSDIDVSDKCKDDSATVQPAKVCFDQRMIDQSEIGVCVVNNGESAE